MSVANNRSTIKSALVTGGAGFIGSHLVEALVATGCRVTVLDNLSTGHLENLEACRQKITLIEGDIRDEKALTRAARECEVVFHIAAEIFVQHTIENPVESAEINTIGTLNVLEAARQNRARRVVLSSSCAVYGNPVHLPVTENDPAAPLSPYAVQKLTAEQYATIYSKLYGLEAVSLRYFNVYGPRQDSSSPYSGIISVFLNRAINVQKPIIHGDGEQSRDFIYVRDVVTANLIAADQTGISGEVFNIGTGQQITMNKLCLEVGSTAGVDLAPFYEPKRKGDVRASAADTNLAEKKLGFKAETNLTVGLAKTYQWYMKRLKAEVKPNKPEVRRQMPEP